MIFFLFGEDIFRINRRLKEIVKQYLKEGFALKIFDFSDSSFFDFKKEVLSSSLFSKKRVFVVKNAFLLVDQSKQSILELLKNNSSDAFIFVESKIVSSGKLYSFLLKKSKLEKFPLLDRADLRTWVKKEFSKYQVQVGERALSLILDYTGNDLWSLSTEVAKLAIFKGKGKEITEKDIRDLVISSVDLNIFRVVDSVLLRDRKESLRLLIDYLKNGKSVFVLFATLSSSLRNVLLVKDGLEQGRSYSSLLRELKIPPFIFRKSYQFSRKYNLPELKKTYQKIFILDNSVKKGKITPEMAFSLLLFDS